MNESLDETFEVMKIMGMEKVMSKSFLDEVIKTSKKVHNENKKVFSEAFYEKCKAIFEDKWLTKK